MNKFIFYNFGKIIGFYFINFFIVTEMISEIEKYKQIIKDLQSQIKQQQETINEYKKLNESLQQEVNDLNYLLMHEENKLTNELLLFEETDEFIEDLTKPCSDFDAVSLYPSAMSGFD